MKFLRQLAVLVIVVVLVGAAMVLPGNNGQTVAVNERGSGTVSAEATSSTWFCASQGSTGALNNIVTLTNAADTESIVSLRALGHDGEVGATQVTVAPLSTQQVNIATVFETSEVSLIIESRPGTIGVEHTHGGEQGTATEPCVDAAGSTWYFTNQRTTLGVTHELYIMNPFATDAGIDVAVAAQDGVRFPTEAQGMVVPAHSVRRVDLAEIGGRWEDAAVSVNARTGRVVAATVMTFDGGEHVVGQSGVQITSGVTTGQTLWQVPIAFSGTNTGETMMVYNPGDDDAQVTAQIVPFGATDLLPEPFTLTVAPGRFDVIDLSAESRVSGVGYHSVVVESDNDVPFIVGIAQSILDVTDADTLAAATEAGVANRPNIAAGRTQRAMTQAPASSWLIGRVAPSAQESVWLALTNPHNQIVRVAVMTMDGEPIVDNVELAPHDGTVVPLNASRFPDAAALIVAADYEIFVTRIQARTSGLGDISFVSAFPLVEADS